MGTGTAQTCQRNTPTRDSRTRPQVANSRSFKRELLLSERVFRRKETDRVPGCTARSAGVPVGTQTTACAKAALAVGETATKGTRQRVLVCRSVSMQSGSIGRVWCERGRDLN